MERSTTLKSRYTATVRLEALEKQSQVQQNTIKIGAERFGGLQKIRISHQQHKLQIGSVCGCEERIVISLTLEKKKGGTTPSKRTVKI